MPEPCLVVHGVAQRDATAFNEQVEKLAMQLNGSLTLVPVFWGDLGASFQYIDAAIPKVMAEQVRESPADLAPFFAESSHIALREGTDEPERIVMRAAGLPVTGEDIVVRGPSIRNAMAETVQKEWPETQYLKSIKDPQLLQEIGKALGNAVALLETPTTTARPVVRDEPTRGLINSVQEKTRQLLKQLDVIVGTSVGNAIGTLNQLLREKYGKNFVAFFGDIFVYQRSPEAIHQRILSVLADKAPGYGRDPERPVNVIAHSLGGVISFDLAINPGNKLWIKHFITFGSQSPFFHLMDPRQSLTQFAPGHPVKLPPSIQTWTNLWEVMDTLAFIAGQVFQLDSGEQPRDIRINSAASTLVEEKGSTHGSYWQCSELISVLNGLSL